MTTPLSFVPNSQDDMHCVQAVFRMLHQYYFHKDLSWDEIDKLLKVIPGKGTWTFVGLTEFAKKGLDIVNIEPIDYQRLFHEGVDYLSEIVGHETAQYYLTKSNIESVIPYIPEFLKTVKTESRKSSIDEICSYLTNGALIGVEVNASQLNQTSGFNLHYVLVYGFEDNQMIFHDPGLPALEGRKVSVKEFEKAFLFDGANAGITIFRKSSKHH